MSRIPSPVLPLTSSRFVSAFRLGAAGAALTVALLASAGCHEDNLVENHKTDDSFIRVPGETAKLLPIAAGSLFPVHPGDQWNMGVQVGDQRSVEQIVDTGTTTINGVTGHIFELRRNGKAYREEIYNVDPSGSVSLMASGSQKDLMQMSPPIPIFRQPVVDGDAQDWTGILHFKGLSSPGTALSRVTGRNTVKTPAGAFNAYRVDTMITTTINGQPAAFPVKRWITPGAGVIQLQMVAGTTVLTKQVQSYTVAKN